MNSDEVCCFFPEINSVPHMDEKKQKQEFQNCAFRLRRWSPPAEVFAIDF